MVVREMWITVELPRDLLDALHALNAALADPALIHGSTQYFALRREVFELERRCAAVIEEQDHAEWALRYLRMTDPRLLGGILWTELRCPAASGNDLASASSGMRKGSFRRQKA